jgi:hypothetical protein
MADYTIKLWVGTGPNGKRLKEAVRAESIKKYHAENMSRLLLGDFCEKHGYDFMTGLPLKTSEKEKR